jgi:hypothetical protein
MPASKAPSSAASEALFCNNPANTSLIRLFLLGLELYYVSVGSD